MELINRNELHKGNYVSYNYNTVKFIEFVDEKKCQVQLSNGKLKTVPFKKLSPIYVDDEFCIQNGFKKIEHYPYVHYKYNIDDIGSSIIMNFEKDVFTLKMGNVPEYWFIQSEGNNSLHYFQNMVRMIFPGENVLQSLNVPKDESSFDVEWITF